MCLLIGNADEQKEFIDEDDIHCWKCLEKKENHYVSPIRKFIYTGPDQELPEVKLVFVYDKYFECFKIEEGYHSYATKEKALLKKEPHEVVVEFIIPKGTGFVLKHGNYVSGYFKFFKEI